MNLKPEQIPDEVVEAAVAAWLEHPDVGSVQSMYSGMAYALAAALPVLLGELVAWMANNGDVMSARSRSTCTRASSLSRYHIALVRMPETPNDHP